MIVGEKKYRLAQKSSFLILILFYPIVIWFISLFLKKYGIGFVPVLLAGVLLIYPSYLFLMRKYIRRRKILKQDFPAEWEDILNREVAYFSTLSESQKSNFKKEIQIFLAEKIISGIETEIDDEIRVLIAASAVIPIFSFPDWEYDNLSEILIYPRNFDENFDFNKNNGNILGLVGIGNSMVLSKPALIRGFKVDKDKINVGFHEFIHKVDGKDKQYDGIPSCLITGRNMYQEWVTIMDEEIEKIQTGESDINPYGGTNRTEFFAVASEYFFENPQAMINKHPALYRILSKIFRQDTKTMFKNVIKSFFCPYGKKIGRNSPCPCGSGRKYKHCCLLKKLWIHINLKNRNI